VIRPKIIYLLVPARRPEIFTNKLDGFKRLGKVWLSVAQSTGNVRSSMRRAWVERMYVPFGDIRANMHPDCL